MTRVRVVLIGGGSSGLSVSIDGLWEKQPQQTRDDWVDAIRAAVAEIAAAERIRRNPSA